MRCDAMRCDAMRCDAVRCDAMRCDAGRARVPSLKSPASTTAAPCAIAANLCARPCNVPGCSMQHAVSRTQYATRILQHGKCNTHHATCSMQRAQCNMKHATRFMQHAACHRTTLRRPPAACCLPASTCRLLSGSREACLCRIISAPCLHRAQRSPSEGWGTVWDYL